MSATLVLASASTSRLSLLRGAGFDPEVVVSGVDELEVAARGTEDIVAVLASRKAEAVAALRPDALVLGCDSLLEVDGEPVGKPASPTEALQRWRTTRGRAYTLYTGHVLIDAARGARAAEVVATVVRFGTPSDDEIDAYVAIGEPMGAAGAFTLEGRSGPFIDGIEGDWSNVMGLSLPAFRRLCTTLGVGITTLWRR